MFPGGIGAFVVSFYALRRALRSGRVVSAVLVVAAVGLMFVPGGQIAGSAILYGVVSGAVMGMATTAVLSDLKDTAFKTETKAGD